ncbi:SirB1 family protein [Planktothrix mougeotii]|uniref:Tetratricopeptide repeat protein n=1 Tax=Planktothrix mougeotii LEGE 06226 TaxID=1828728 RepID=A0ABR9UK72_9CYAN|nr:transglutaminase-like domain-containing protein [Planktothrix mougeotii]MBE9146871.1 tetratricopeptide repeat protein [Planktothrix mougeotii LEGE 06226]
MNYLQARQRFFQEIQQPEEQIDLAKAALYIAQEEYPEIEPEEYLNALDTMASEILERLPQERYPLRVIQTINHYLYEDLGFRGNQNNYYDAKNSYFNEVINRRTGIPITLSLVYLELCKRIDFPMVGIGMPGHFLIRPEFEDAKIYVDAFNQGEILFPEDCTTRLTQIYQQPIEMQPEFLAAVNPRQFLGRMLMNLKVIYLNEGKIEQALGVIERILLLFPDSVNEKRDRGILYYHQEQWREAQQDLENYLEILPMAQDAAIIRQILDQMSQNM